MTSYIKVFYIYIFQKCCARLATAICALLCTLCHIGFSINHSPYFSIVQSLWLNGKNLSWNNNHNSQQSRINQFKNRCRIDDILEIWLLYFMKFLLPALSSDCFNRNTDLLLYNIVILPALSLKNRQGSSIPLFNTCCYAT